MELTVITGMSGAGKSQAMGTFEDAGWFVVDNLPPRLLPHLAGIVDEDDDVVKAAVVCDIRGGEYFADLPSQLGELERTLGTRARVLFLEASDDVLLNRFRETRRRHPLAGEGGTLSEGIARERERLAAVRERADVIIDTSELNIWELRRQVAEAMLDVDARPRMQVLVQSFGFKYGAPADADLLLDVRFIENPHYNPRFAPLTGLDPEVADFVARTPEMQGFAPRLDALLDFLLPAYAAEGKSHLVIGFGCTGGRHRSVALAERTGRRYRGRPEFQVSVSHRDIGRATLRAPQDAPGGDT